MAIAGRTLGAAAGGFRDHLNTLLHKTITQHPLSMVPYTNEQGVPQMQLTFRDGILPCAARLHSHLCGDLDLYVGQVCEARPDAKGRQRLYTASYRYALSPAGETEAVFRWDYVRKWPYQIIEDETGQAAPEREKWCRHHLQGTPLISLGKYQVCLQDVHLPTGYVAIEDVIRFCLTDLGVKALTDEEEWHDLLNDSYARFIGDFVVDEPNEEPV